jgi:aminopeptidase N
VIPLRAAALLAVIAIGILPVPGGPRKPFSDATAAHHEPPDRAIDAIHLHLDLSFDASRKWVGGEATLTLTPFAAPLDTVALDAEDLRIREVREGASRREFRVAGGRLLVDLGRAVPPGEEIVLAVSYEANPRRGLYFVGPDRGYPAKPVMVYSQGQTDQSRAWFPCVDSPNERMTWEQSYTVPVPFTAVGNGRLVEVKSPPGGRSRTFRWMQEIPAPAYLVSVAIAEYDVIREEHRGVPIEYYVPRGTPKETALRSFGLTPDMMEFFSSWIGVAYPYPRYAQTTIVDFLHGGMENLGATTQTYDTLHPAEVDREASSVGLVAHELAHQWWGDLLTCRDWAHAWLNEGFATYFENLYKERRLGADEFQYEMFRDAEAYFEEDEKEYRRPIVQEVFTHPDDLFDSHLYPKGGWTLHMLRGILGDDLFRESLQAYAQTHRAGSVVTEDLRKSVEETTGRSLEWFFRQWYLRGGHPEIRITQDWDAASRLVRLRVEQTQATDALTPVFRAPVRIAFHGDAGVWEFPVELADAAEEFAFPLPEAPRMTRFDAGYHLLKKLEFPRTAAELTVQLREDPDVPGRIWAAEQLATRVRDGGAASALAVALSKEPFWGVRAEIARSLRKLRLAESRDALIAARGDSDTRVRAAAIASLGSFREDPKAADAIRRAWREEKNDYVRAAAAKAFASARASGALSLLREALATPSHRDVIAVAASEGMEDLGDPAAVPALRDAARYGRPRRQREAAIRALGKLAKGDAKRPILDLLLDLLHDPWIFARDAAIQALGDARDDTAVPALADAARGETDARLRRHARQAIEAIRSAGSATELEELRRRIEQMEDSTRGLRERIERLEREKGSPPP